LSDCQDQLAVPMVTNQMNLSNTA